VAAYRTLYNVGLFVRHPLCQLTFLRRISSWSTSKSVRVEACDSSANRSLVSSVSQHGILSVVSPLSYRVACFRALLLYPRHLVTRAIVSWMVLAPSLHPRGPLSQRCSMWLVFLSLCLRISYFYWDLSLKARSLNRGSTNLWLELSLYFPAVR
jgi:hypothetical protein